MSERDELWLSRAQDWPLTEVDGADDEIVQGDGMVATDMASIEAVAEVHSQEGDEIVHTDVEEHNSWQRAAKHLNGRITELEARLAELESVVKDLQSK